VSDKSVAELVEKYRPEHEELLALAKGKPLRFMLWGTEGDAFVSVLAPDQSLEQTRGFIEGPSPRGMQVRPYDETTRRALEFLLSFDRSFSLFTTPTFRFFVTKGDNGGWSLTAKCLYENGKIGVFEAGDGHPTEAICDLVKSLTDSFEEIGERPS